jgi:hypothetical protein
MEPACTFEGRYLMKMFGINVLSNKSLNSVLTRAYNRGVISGRNDISKWAIKLKRTQMDYATLEDKYAKAVQENAVLRATAADYEGSMKPIGNTSRT